MLKALALAAAAMTALPASGQGKDPRSPLQQYEGHQQFTLTMCSLEFKIAMQEVELKSLRAEPPADRKPSDPAGCIRDAKRDAMPLLRGALSSVKKERAREALKAAHVAYVTALEGILPGSDERRISYSARQAALQDRVREAWTRFEIEQ